MVPTSQDVISRKAAAIEPSATLEVTALAAALRAQGKDVIAFAAGEPDLPTPAEVNETAIEAIRASRGRYTAAAGLPDLRDVIARKFQRDGFGFGADEVMCTAGAKSGIFEALFTILNESDEVLFPAPYWGSYTELVRAAGGRPVPIKTLPETDFQPRAEQLRAALTPRSRALILNSPNNPTGTVYSKETLLEIADVVRQHALVVISDDIYDSLIYTGEPYANILHVAPDLAGRTLVVNSLSKSHSMTGWRLGYVGGPRPIIQAMARVQSQIAGNPHTISQLAAITALEASPDPGRIASLDVRRRLLLKEIETVRGLVCPVPRGAFYAFPSIAELLGKRHRGIVLDTSSAFSRALLETKLVATVPGDAFGGPDHLRFTYTIPAHQIEEGIRRLRDFVAELE